MQSHCLPGSQGLNALRERFLEQKSIHKDASARRHHYRTTITKVCASTAFVEIQAEWHECIHFLHPNDTMTSLKHCLRRWPRLINNSSGLGTALQRLYYTQAVVAEGPLVMPEEKKLKVPTKYCESIYQTIRRPTRTIQIGKVETGSAHPVRLQTMTTTGEDSKASAAFTGRDLVP